jgi:AcrR family transcriptional regulator
MQAGQNRRSRGRPPEQGGEDLRERLLDVAEERFSANGYDATPIRAVAEDAGVNPALVHYYFGTKRELLLAVLHRALEPLAEAVAMLREAPEVETREVTAVLFRAIAAHPNLPRLMVREVLLGDGSFRDYFAEHFAPRLGAVLARVIGNEQGHDHLDRAFDPNTLVVMILGLCLFPFVAQPVAEPLLGIAYDEAGRQRLFEHVDRILHKGILP